MRDTSLFVVGVSGIVYEAVTHRVDPTLTLAFLAMIGLPIPLRQDEQKGDD